MPHEFKRRPAPLSLMDAKSDIAKLESRLASIEDELAKLQGLKFVDIEDASPVLTRIERALAANY